MTVDLHVGVTLAHQSGRQLQEGPRPIGITNKNNFASHSLHILNALQTWIKQEVQGQKEINLNKPNKMNATHKMTRFVKSSREKGAVNLINKKGMYSMHSFPTCTNTLQLMNTSCATYCSEKLQAEKHCILMHPVLTAVRSRLTRDNVGAGA